MARARWSVKSGDVRRLSEQEATGILGLLDGEEAVLAGPGVLSGTWMGEADICRSLRVGTRTFYRWRRAQGFPAPDLRLGKIQRWRQQTIEKWVADIIAREAISNGKDVVAHGKRIGRLGARHAGCV